MLQVSAGVLQFVSGADVFGPTVVTAVLVAVLAPAARRTAIAIAVALPAWLGIAYALAEAGASPLPLFGLRVVAPLAVAAVAFALFEPLRRLASDPELRPTLIAVQTYRVIGGSIMLFLLALNALPALFAVPVGTGDVLIGLTAIWAARSVRAGRTSRAVLWNLLGLLDFAVAFTTAVVSGAAAIGVLPLVLIPTYGVPLSIVLHVVSLRSLAAARAPARAFSALALLGPERVQHRLRRAAADVHPLPDATDYLRHDPPEVVAHLPKEHR